MSCAPEYGPQLRSHGARLTAQRLAILHVLRHSRQHLPPLEVYARARRTLPRLAQPTVYRTLQFLTRSGLVWETHLDNGHLAYELADSDHHHVRCKACGRQVLISHGAVADAYRRLEVATGFALDHQHLTLSGLCPKCRKRKPREGGY